MSTFSTLFKYELRKQFPIRLKKDKADIIGTLLSFLVTAVIIGMFVYFLSVIAKNYVEVKIDKVLDSTSRAYELLNVFYSIILTFMIFVCLENMRKTLTDGTDKKILLRLPVKEQTLFLSKLLVLLLKNYVLAFLLIIPTNIILYLALMPSGIFWLMTVIVWLFFPLIVSLFTSILIVPYIKIMNFVRNKYILIFAVLAIILAGFVLIYMAFLGIVQGYLETGFIKFLFNEEFIKTLQNLLLWTYPSNCLAGIVLCKDLVKSFLIVIACVVISITLMYFVTKNLYHIALYRSDSRKSVYKKSNKIKKHSVIGGLIKKEFISVSREPKHIFSYLVIATIMPILVYCCYTLFESLILNMIGIKITFALALFIVTVFTVLTNTFCATNITREGTSLLKQKTFPIKASQILSSKVIFCFIVSLMSVIISAIVLIFATSLTFWDGLLCMIVGILFSIAQILIATRLDLKNTRMSFTFQQVQKKSATTIAKVVTLGLIVAILIGVSSLLISVLSQSSILSNVNIHICFAYIIPVVLSLIYVGLAILFYFYKLQKSLDNITM